MTKVIFQLYTVTHNFTTDSPHIHHIYTAYFTVYLTVFSRHISPSTAIFSRLQPSFDIAHMALMAIMTLMTLMAHIWFTFHRTSTTYSAHITTHFSCHILYLQLAHFTAYSLHIHNKIHRIIFLIQYLSAHTYIISINLYLYIICLHLQISLYINICHQSVCF